MNLPISQGYCRSWTTCWCTWRASPRTTTLSCRCTPPPPIFLQLNTLNTNPPVWGLVCPPTLADTSSFECVCLCLGCCLCVSVSMSVSVCVLDDMLVRVASIAKDNNVIMQVRPAVPHADPAVR